jgi:ribosomal protein L37AE/L43A
LNQTNHFFDLGYGWLCKHCSAADAEATHQPEHHASFFSHDDSEKKQAQQSGLALATWTDTSRHALICPRCGIAETIART